MDHYQYSVSDAGDSVNAFRLAFDIDQTYFRSEFTFAPDNKNQISYGLSSIFYKLHPGSYTPVGS